MSEMTAETKEKVCTHLRFSVAFYVLHIFYCFFVCVCPVPVHVCVCACVSEGERVSVCIDNEENELFILLYDCFHCI